MYPKLVSNNMPSVKRVSFGSYLVLFLGIALFFVAVSTIIYSELQSSRRAVTLNEMAHLVRDVSGEERVFSEYEGDYVFVNGQMSSQAMLSDQEFALQARAITLQRSVEIFQSVERVEQITGAERERRIKQGLPTATTVYYSQWVPAAVENSPPAIAQSSSSAAQHLHYSSYIQYAKHVMLGAYQLTPSILERLNLPQVVVDHTKLDIPVKLASRVTMDEHYLYILSSDHRAQQREAASISPQLGDQRLRWYVTLPGEHLSIIAQQQGMGLVPLSSSSEKDVTISHLGLTTLPALLEYSADRESYEKRTLRLGVVLVLWIAFCFITGRMVRIAPGSFFWVGLVHRFGFISSLSLTVLTLFPIISVAILRSEPQRGFILLLVSLFLSVLFYLLCTSRGRAVLRDRMMHSAVYSRGNN